MKFTVFQSEKGDCLLLTSAEGKNILADGGMAKSYEEHVAPYLSRMRARNEAIDLAYVSHIDDDHIAGVLQLMDDEAAWRVYDYQTSAGNEGFPRPRNPRPAEVLSIWHNAFHDQVGRNAGPIEELLAASSAILSGSTSVAALETAEKFYELALSKRQAIRLSRRVGKNQLRIPLNEPSEGRLMYVRPALSPFNLGALRIYVIGPFESDLHKLRLEWNEWLRENSDAVRSLREKAAEDERNMGNDVARLERLLRIRADQLGRREKVTTPNLASLMLLVEEAGDSGGISRFLMTGDGAWQDIIKGLTHNGFLSTDDSGFHVNVLKVQHHGSENNANRDFFKRITADHYIFCGNGEHGNPDPRIVKMLLASRIGSTATLSRNPEAGNRFKVWFNSSSTASSREAARRHMAKLEELMAESARETSQVRYQFLSGSRFSFTA